MTDEFSKDKFDNLIAKYKSKLNTDLNIDKKVNEHSKQFEFDKKISSAEYEQFKKEYVPPHLSLYEKLCGISEKLLKVKPDKKKEVEIQKWIDICHLNVTPTGSVSFSLLAFLFISLFGPVVSYFAIFMLTGEKGVFFPIFFIFAGMVAYPALTNIPKFYGNSWRLKASNQMVLCIFYMVTYMRHTSNLELAIEFASQHLAPPLSLDLKKVLWNVETEKFDSVKDSLDDYLNNWKEWNIEFIESIHLIESSLYETSDDRRIIALEKSLTVMLEETYEKMLHYAHNLKSPITMLHMLGVILPILGLVILPLMVAFMPSMRWYYLAAIYNVALPVGVYYLGKIILSTRPTGYGDSDMSDENPEMKKFKNIIINLGGYELKIPPLYVSVMVGFILLLTGLSPIIIHYTSPDFDYSFSDDEESSSAAFSLLGYVENKDDSTKMDGPFGIGAAFMSFFITLSVGLGFGLYYKLRSKNIIKLRNQAKKLELEFSGALFQLGNRLGDGLPAELAFSKVAAVMDGTVSGSFFNDVSNRITKMGMAVEEAIFDPKMGALAQYPSNLIESSMKVFTESVKKGPRVASNALINISEYIKEIHKVNERLKDLLADIISSMKSQIAFLTPAISGIVIGITSMITTILGHLGQSFGTISGSSGGGGGMMDGLFFGNGIPTYFFQIVVGLYVVQITFILTTMTNGIENGADILNERYLKGQNMIRSTILYSVIAIIIMIIFNMVASKIMEGL